MAAQPRCSGLDQVFLITRQSVVAMAAVRVTRAAVNKSIHVSAAGKAVKSLPGPEAPASWTAQETHITPRNRHIAAAPQHEQHGK